MELMSRHDVAMRLGVSVGDVDEMIRDGILFAVRFATGVKVLVDPDEPGPPHVAGRIHRG